MRQPDAPQDAWSRWVFANETYHWCEKDPLVDWLIAYGARAGFVADSQRPGNARRFVAGARAATLADNAIRTDVETGLRRTVEWWPEQEAAQTAAVAKRGQPAPVS